MKTYYIKILLIVFFIQVPVVKLFAQNNPADIIHLKRINEELINPVRITLDKSDNLYVTDSKQNCIFKYNSSGNLTEKINLDFSPVSVVADKNGDIFTGDKDSGYIYRIGTDKTISVFYRDCAFPAYLDLSPDGILYVADSKYQQISVIDKAGNLINTFGNGILVYPSSVKYDGINKRIFVGEHGGIGTGFKPVCKVWVFDTEGNLINSFGSYGAGDGEFYRIQGITIGKCNNIYVCDTYQGNISVFDENFNFITKFGKYGTNIGELDIPLDVAFNSKEEILISSLNNSSVEIFSITDSLPSSAVTNSDAVLCTGETANIEIKFTGIPPWNFTYTVDDTNPVSLTTVDNPYILNVSDPGIYKITQLSDAHNTGTCFTGGAVIKKYDQLPSIDISAETTSICRGDTAQIKFDLYGTPPWSFSYESESGFVDVITYKTPYFASVTEGGKYRVTKMSDAFCEAVNFRSNVVIDVSEEPLPDFDFSANGFSVNFINRSVYGETYFWDFGDGTTSNETNPGHTYSSPGDYSVTLTAANPVCGDTVITKIITVSNTSVSENPNIRQNKFNLYPNPTNGRFIIEFDNTEKKDVTVEIINVTGQIIFSGHYKTEMIYKEIDLGNIASGIYTVRLKSDKQIESLKLIIE